MVSICVFAEPPHLMQHSNTRYACPLVRSQVDGCAIFWRRAKFRLAENYTVEFNECARRAVSAMPGLLQEEAHQFLMRVSKDNVAQVLEGHLVIPMYTARPFSVHPQMTIGSGSGEGVLARFSPSKEFLVDFHLAMDAARDLRTTAGGREQGGLIGQAHRGACC